MDLFPVLLLSISIMGHLDQEHLLVIFHNQGLRSGQDLQKNHHQLLLMIQEEPVVSVLIRQNIWVKFRGFYQLNFEELGIQHLIHPNN